ncbi:MAG: hypothetical protein EAZ79_08060, partial [Oscillatoriales cyanobacterium]|uniref:hypothetical protein n=1 Tax=unclassified Microcoleus TaxID=2642155 RepID=UPI0025F8682F
QQLGQLISNVISRYGKHFSNYSLLRSFPSGHYQHLQADIINKPERVFIGINDNGRQVTVFYKDGNVVITQNNDFTRVITAYGRSGISRFPGGRVKAGTPVSPNRWMNSPNYLEISK